MTIIQKIYEQFKPQKQPSKEERIKQWKDIQKQHALLKDAYEKVITESEEYRTECLEEALEFYLEGDIKCTWMLCEYAAEADDKIRAFETQLFHYTRDVSAAKEKLIGLNGLLDDALKPRGFDQLLEEYERYQQEDDHILDGRGWSFGKKNTYKEIYKDSIAKAAYCYFALTAIKAENRTETPELVLDELKPCPDGPQKTEIKNDKGK